MERATATPIRPHADPSPSRSWRSRQTGRTIATTTDHYRCQPESTYAPDQPIWLYAVTGLAGQPVDSDDDGGDADAATVATDLQQTLVVEDPDGNRVVESQETFQGELSPREIEGYYTGTEILLAGRAATAEYATTLSVTDRVSETEASETATFSIAE